MTLFRITITGDRFPTDYNIEASGWATAIGRAVREWKKRFKGSRVTELKIRAIKSSPIIRTIDDEKSDL